MKLLATRKSDQNRAMLDPWTVVHFGAGLAAGLVRAPMGPTLAAAVAWEVAEQLAERDEFAQELFEVSGPETVPNLLVDVIVFAVGHRLGTLWNDT